MKIKILSLVVFIAIISIAFTKAYEIGQCFISFSNASGLTPAPPDRLPADAEKFRDVPTDTGQVNITRIDGYRILYLTDKNVPFVNMKVELSDSVSYETDQQKILDNLKYIVAHSENMETGDIIKLEFNGYKIYGVSRSTIESGSTLGTFVMFPGNGITVYFYFNNLKPEFRNFESVGDYKKLRDKFMNEYTNYIATCK